MQALPGGRASCCTAAGPHARDAGTDMGMAGCTRYRVPGTRYPPDLVLVLGQSETGPRPRPQASASDQLYIFRWPWAGFSLDSSTTRLRLVLTRLDSSCPTSVSLAESSPSRVRVEAGQAETRTSRGRGEARLVPCQSSLAWPGLASPPARPDLLLVDRELIGHPTRSTTSSHQ